MPSINIYYGDTVMRNLFVLLMFLGECAGSAAPELSSPSRTILQKRVVFQEVTTSSSESSDPRRSPIGSNFERKEEELLIVCREGLCAFPTSKFSDFPIIASRKEDVCIFLDCTSDQLKFFLEVDWTEFNAEKFSSAQLEDLKLVRNLLGLEPLIIN